MIISDDQKSLERKLFKVQTITPVYDNIEDRIKLSINYQDMQNRIDLMLTRSFLLQLLPAMEEYIYKHYPDEIIEDEVHIEALKEQIDDDTKNKNISKTNFEDLHLYRSLEELLLTVNMTYDKNSRLTRIEFIGKEGDKAVLNADAVMLNNILKSIKASIPSIAWGISGYF